MQLVNQHKDTYDSPMVVDGIGQGSTSAQKRLKRPRPPRGNSSIPEGLKTPTSSMKRLRISPEKGSVSPSKPGGDYFSSVHTDSEEEEGEVDSQRSGESLLIFSCSTSKCV